MIVAGQHDFGLVALSVLVAIAASYTALDLFPRARRSTGRVRLAWLIAAAVAMAGGIWSMHFIGMLALVMPMTISYDIGLTFVSLLLPIVVTAMAFVIVNRRPAHLGALLGSGLVLGLSIVTMHYLGMAAMRMPGMVAHARGFVLLASAIAIVAATAALWLAGRDTGFRARILAAMVMGFAVSGMHYTAMAGAHFTGHHGMDRVGGFGQTGLALAVAGLTSFILLLAWTAALFDRRFAAAEVKTAQAREERFRDLYRRTPLPLFSLDMSGHIEQASAAFATLIGRDPDDLTGRHIDDILVSEDDASEPVDLDAPALERRIRSISGEVLDICIMLETERDARGAPLRRLGGIVDLTARRQVEAALLQSQKMEAVGQLTGGVAHDFNNLLMAISGNLDLALRRVTPEDADTTRYLERARTAVERGARLTQQLLAFSRRQRLTVEPTSVNTIVGGALELMSSTLGGTVSVKAELARDIPLAMADATQVDLILLNLAINARDAMPDGGTITVRTEACERTGPPSAPEGPGPGRYVRLSVEDEGSGMPFDVLARVFEPFFTTKEIGKGSGLGLPQVLGIVKQLSGGIEIRTEPGRGTRVDVYLPVAQLGQTPRPVETARPAALPEGLFVLLVDDDADVLQATASMLEELGCRVLSCTEGAEAIEAIRTDPAVDLVLADHAMPGLPGEQTLAAIAEIRPDLPGILMSGYAEGISASATMRVLRKPFTLSDLERALAGALPPRAGTGV